MSSDLDFLPPEIFARIFEVGTLTWGIGFLAPVCLVCKSWNDIITTTPHLWGIIIVTKSSKSSNLHAQLAKAKAFPLTVIFSSNVSGRRISIQPVLKRLVSLSHNWVAADVSTEILSQCRWSEMRSSLQELKLFKCDFRIVPDLFFNVDDAAFGSFPKLHSFKAHSLPSAWIDPFLSPSITYLDLFFDFKECITLPDASHYFSRVPEVKVVKLTRFPHGAAHWTLRKPVRLAKLATLELNLVTNPSHLLCQISAPSLQTLSIQHKGKSYYPRYHWEPYREPELAPLTLFFSQWSQGDFITLHLHTLELCDCLKVDDIPYLIRWLARLPSLVRLSLLDDAIDKAAEMQPSSQETNVLKALASPEGIAGAWLCPSLTHLHLTTGSLMDLLEVTRVRGVFTPPSSAAPPSRLRSISALLCSSGSNDDIEELKGLVHNVRCVCLGCEFNLTI